MDYFFVMMIIISTASGGYTNGEETKVPPGCEGQSFCTIQPDDYAAKAPAMKEAIKQIQDSDEYPRKRYQRDTDSDTDYENCASKPLEYKPYTINVETMDPGTKTVIQSESFQQIIYQTKCVNENAPCFDSLKFDQDGDSQIETGCKEINSTITIYILDGGTFKQVPFNVPVACVCDVKYVNN